MIDSNDPAIVKLEMEIVALRAVILALVQCARPGVRESIVEDLKMGARFTDILNGKTKAGEFTEELSHAAHLAFRELSTEIMALPKRE